jgi:hypothetical protein
LHANPAYSPAIRRQYAWLIPLLRRVILAHGCKDIQRL